jgi:hypothetical protein
VEADCPLPSVREWQYALQLLSESTLLLFVIRREFRWWKGGLDSIHFHSADTGSERSISLIEAAGARVKHIPAYSPDFNLIEECISKIKEALRAAYVKRSIGLFRVVEQRLLKIRRLQTCPSPKFRSSANIGLPSLPPIQSD